VLEARCYSDPQRHPAETSVSPGRRETADLQSQMRKPDDPAEPNVSGLHAQDAAPPGIERLLHFGIPLGLDAPARPRRGLGSRSIAFSVSRGFRR
jgi:hypothetical protein